MMNPKQMVLQMIQNGAGSNIPVIQNMISLAQQGDSAGVERVARNLFQAKGIDFEAASKQYANMFPQFFK